VISTVSVPAGSSHAARPDSLLRFARFGNDSGFVAYESRLELARVLLADFDQQVHWIYAQPFRLVAHC
jgi:hypothetical protein